MHIAEIDLLANFGDSIFHRAHTRSKLVFTIFYLAVTISSVHLGLLSALLGGILLLYYSCGIPIIRVGHLALYPVFFSILFALILSQGSWEIAAMIILRALAAALSLIFLFCTTPYVDLFSYLSRWMPSLLGDIFFFCYRGLFIMFHKFSNLMKIIKLRGGFRPLALVYEPRNTAGMMGLLLIQSFAVSERMYRVFSLRGYDGFVPRVQHAKNQKSNITLNDAIVLILSIILLGIGAVVVWL